MLTIIRNCSLYLETYSGCRFRTVMSNHALPTCHVLADEQCGLADVPDDHEQSGVGVVGAELDPGTSAASALAEGLPETIGCPSRLQLVKHDRGVTEVTGHLKAERAYPPEC